MPHGNPLTRKGEGTLLLTDWYLSVSNVLNSSAVGIR